MPDVLPTAEMLATACAGTGRFANVQIAQTNSVRPIRIVVTPSAVVALASAVGRRLVSMREVNSSRHLSSTGGGVQPTFVGLWSTGRDSRAIVASITPIEVSTLYTRIGDVFAWACVLGVALAVMRRPRLRNGDRALGL
jgi:hypothetical protein